MNLRYLAIVASLLVVVSCNEQPPASPTPTADTPENRREAAERYLSVVPPVELFKDVGEKVAETLPEAARPAFVRAMTKELDVAKLSTAMLNSMVARFTVAEIDALAKFYGSPEGKSVMKKLGLYMADVMPVIEAETIRAFDRIKEVPE